MLSPAPLALRRGLSIVEFMVGIVVGLFVVGGAAKLFVDYLSSNRKAMLETRVNQDLRAAADLVARDLRRAGYWRNATTGLYLGAVAPAASNPYAQVTYDAGANSLTYRYAKDGDDVPDADEQFGVMADGALKLLVGGSWQAITDPSVMTINSADLQIPLVAERSVDLYTACPCFARSSCTENSFKNPDPDKLPTVAPGDNWANRPRVVVREYELRITARSTVAQSTGAEVVREVRERIRPRNDVALGKCPA